MRWTLNILIFIASAALMATLIRRIAPEPVVPIVTSKVTHFREHGEDFDVLFLGSSRTYRQVIPEIFDAELAAAGHPVKAYNLGVDGMRPPEDTYVLEQALRDRKKPLRWVFVECSPIRLVMRAEDRGTLRAIYWHDAKRAATLFRRAFLADEKKRKFRDRLKEVGRSWPDFEDHAEYFFHHFFQIGRGFVLGESLLFKGKLPEIPNWDIGKRGDGYRPSDQPEQMPPAELGGIL